MKRRSIHPLLLALPLALLLPGVALARDLTFEDRVNCQEAIERVYYAHQIGVTKPFEEAVPREVLENKVRTYLKQSVALAEFWKTPITADMLRAEMDRMARQTQMPERLRELYVALGSDALLFQECVARPSLVSRLAHNFFSGDDRIQGDARREADDLQRRLLKGEIDPRSDHPRRKVSEVVVGREEARKLASPESTLRRVVPSPQERLELRPPEFQKWRAAAHRSAGSIGAIEEDADAFEIRAILSENAERVEVATYSIPKVPWSTWWDRVETGFNEFKTGAARSAGVSRSPARPVDFESLLSESAACLPDDTWNNGSLGDAPEAMADHSAVWTGNVMLVLGSTDELSRNVRGQIYDPSIDTWTSVSMAGAPSPTSWRNSTLVWTGREAIQWGMGMVCSGYGCSYPASGGRYDPVSNTWRSISTTNVSPRESHTATWTGSAMIVWGGRVCEGNNCQLSNTGDLYDPVSDTWRRISTTNAPTARTYHTAIWTGTLMAVWGGATNGSTDTGGLYDPVSDVWKSMSRTNAPDPNAPGIRSTAVWTGSLILVWWAADNNDGGAYSAGYMYDPLADRWSPMSKTNAPQPWYGGYGDYKAFWTGSEMVVYGADTDSFYTIGGRYDPATDTWKPMSMVGGPVHSANFSAVWTGSLMVVWGGAHWNGAIYYNNSGGRYDPISDSWTPISSGAAPFVGSHDQFVWTGDFLLGTQGRYDPVLDSWTPVSRTNAPLCDSPLVWCGGLMLAGGGCQGRAGGRYDPVSDIWTPMSTTGAPGDIWGGATVCAGDTMLAWNGNGGGRYDPASDTWSSISTTNAPSGWFVANTAFWTGSIMIVWGVRQECSPSRCSYSDSGGRYDPVSNMWSSISTTNAPPFCGDSPGIWSGSEMILWGCGFSNIGGRYDPVSDTWRSTSTMNAPFHRWESTAVWTGTEMVIWGGEDGTLVNTGARYDPLSDTWNPTSTINAPSPRRNHSAVWTGNVMVVWGGDKSESYTDYPPLSTGGRYVVNNSPDSDSDGVTVCAGDCNDANPAVLPGAVETCNGIDDNCDRTTDEGFNVGSACSIVLDECHQLTGAEACLPDGSGTICQGEVVPHDVTPPQVSVAVSPGILWPPDRRMVDVEASVTATDACGTPAVTLTSVSSSEPDDAPGPGDGRTSGDVQGALPGTADFDFQLRAKRDGGGEGRVYRVTYTAVDASGNQATAHAFVRVPHDQGAGAAPVQVSAEDVTAGVALRMDGAPGGTSCEGLRAKIDSLRDAGVFTDFKAALCVLSARAWPIWIRAVPRP